MLDERIGVRLFLSNNPSAVSSVPLFAGRLPWTEPAGARPAARRDRAGMIAAVPAPPPAAPPLSPAPLDAAADAGLMQSVSAWSAGDPSAPDTPSNQFAPPGGLTAPAPAAPAGAAPL